MPLTTRFSAGLAALVVLAVGAGCSPYGAHSQGPLRLGGNPSELCMVHPEHGDAVIGDAITNEGNSSVTIESVDLIDATNLDHLDSYLFPMDGDDDFVPGAVSTEPEGPWEEAAWETVQDPFKFEVQAHTQVSIAVAIDTTVAQRNGTAEAIRVKYSAGGRQYTAQTSTTIELSATSCS